MKRTKMAAAVVAGALAALLLASTALAATSGTVAVTARVRAYAAVTQVDASHVRVQANTPWILDVKTEHGVVHVNGFKTSGTVVALPADTTAYSLIWN
ncbi:MAG: hypothetical protein QMD96_07250 [Anaerosomatales bacterium]|nr:hypothetical protein [Anaerosomatales bacterium]